MSKSQKKLAKIVLKAKPAKLASKAKKAVIKEIVGHGDYRPTTFKRIRGRGDYLGDLFGGLGQKAGNFLQGKFRDITGFGDYRSHGAKKNSLQQMVSRAADTSAQKPRSCAFREPIHYGGYVG